MHSVTRRLLRTLRSADDPLDYRSLIERTRIPGIEIAQGLDRLESDGSVRRIPTDEGFTWAPADAAVLES